MVGAGLVGHTVASARRAMASAFRAAGIDTPELDARVLVGHALSLPHVALAAAADRPLAPHEAQHLADAAARRLAHEPVARIVGSREFWGLPLRLGPATLVPRPETETLVEAALAAIDAEGGRRRSLHMLDIGTGSGALLLALLSELPHAFGIGTDIDPGALEVARINAGELGLAARVAFIACDFAAGVRGPFDLIVANPPYVASGDIATLAPEVRDHDPHLALDGGPDGLDAYRAIAMQTARLLRGGHLVLEVGAGQAAAVGDLLATAGFVVSPPWPDLAGIARAVCARGHAPMHGEHPKKSLGLRVKTD